MFDLFSGPLVQIVWAVIIGLGAVAGIWGWGAKKKREGKKEAKEEALISRDAAADEAAKIRDEAAAKTPDKKRKEVSEWED